MSSKTKIFGCIIETVVAFTFILMASFSLYGFIPELFSPIAGWCEIIGAGILGSDMVLRACDGVGFVG